MANCSASPRDWAVELAWLTCPLRGKPIDKLTGSTAGVGCASSEIEVYRCEHFNEPVLKKAAPRCMRELASKIAGFRRTCETCWKVLKMELIRTAVELTPNLERELIAGGHKVGAVLLPVGASESPHGRVVSLASRAPADVVRAFERSGLACLLVDGEERAGQMRRHTTRRVVGHIDQLRGAGDVVLPNKLNLIYHLAPLRANNVWRHNLDQLCKPHRWRQFNGRRIVAIATGDKLDPPATVRQEFASRNCQDVEFIEVPNDVRLREVASFKMLLTKIRSTKPTEATFYAHSKGNSTADGMKGAWLWTLALYHHLLDAPETIRELLRTYSAVGCTKMVWPPGSIPPYPTRLMVGHWMLAGTFFWFRHDRVFTRPGWDRIADDRYAAEAWPSSILSEHEAVSVYQPWPVDRYPTPSPYDPQVHQPLV